MNPITSFIKRHPKPFQEKLGELSHTNKLAILLEIVVVFVPLYVLLFISNRLGGDDFLPLGGAFLRSEEVGISLDAISLRT